MAVLAVGAQVVLVASAMVVACGGRATSGRSRAAGARTRPTENWLHLVVSAVVLVVLESWVTLLVLVLLLVVECVWVLVLVLPGMRHQRHCRWHHRPEAVVLGPDLLPPVLLVLEGLGR